MREDGGIWKDVMWSGPSLQLQLLITTSQFTSTYLSTPNSIGCDSDSHFPGTSNSLSSAISCIPIAFKKGLMRSFRPYHRPIQRLALRLGQPQRTSSRQFHRGNPIIMSSQREDSIPHELRTAAEPRQNRLYPVRLSHVEQVNPSVRLLQLAIPPQGENVSLLPIQSTVLHVYIMRVCHGDRSMVVFQASASIEVT